MKQLRKQMHREPDSGLSVQTNHQATAKRVQTRIAISAASLVIAFLNCSAQAAQPTKAPRQQLETSSQQVRKAGSTESELFGGHHQSRKLSPAERQPQVPAQLNARVKYGTSEAERNLALPRPSKLSKATLSNGKLMAGAPAAACDTQVFASNSGSALVNAVKTSTTDCINQLFNVTGTTAGQVFNEAKMVSIADAFRTTASSYDGTNSGSSLQMILFLRAGYFVNWYHSADTGPYGNGIKTSIRAAMDAFANNGNFGLVNDAHGEVLSEFVTLVDSAGENARYLNSVVKRLINGYNSSYNAYWWMKSSVNGALNVLFRGHQNDDFKALVQSDTSIIDALYNFVNNNFNNLGGDYGYLVANAGRELGRFLQYTEGSSLKNLAKSRSKLMIDRSNVTGSTASLWVGVGEMIDYYDKANCSYYNLCDFKTKLETNVLTIQHSCSPTLRIRAQALTPAQLTETCNIVGGEESYFHTQAATGKIPVANDNNTQLEMVVFASSKDYTTYAGSIFGISTNNGGMYLEGDPAAAGNQPRFIAYQAEWKLPQFEIWNLTHEYVHYLDGRFDIYGDFNAAMGVNSVWWIEGFAEYMSYSYRNLSYDAAKQQAAAGTYKLSTIFNNDYNSGTTRVYNWGYLAVRYMFEKQRSKVTNILGYFRPGNFTGYATYMNGSTMSASMDNDFTAWLPCVSNPNAPGCGTTPPANLPPVASFTQSVSNLSVNFSDTSTDSDGNIASRSWNFGDGSSSTSANPAKTYASAGSYTVTLTVTDNQGASTSVSKTVTVTAPANVPPVAQFSASVSGLAVTFTDQSTDSDGSIASRSWNFGDGTSSTLANPVKTYAASGTYQVSLTVTDNRGASTTTSRSVSVLASTECSGASVQELGKNCTRSNLSGRAGDYSYFYLYVPAGTTKIVFTTTGGTGDADLYFNTSTWATSSNYQYRSVRNDSNETITINNPPGGTYIYVSVYGYSAFSGVQIKASF
ncbi:MAG: collagenase [Burkholderiales bacterium]|nr:collagenase [Burkholderiales bacterium]